VGGSPAGRSGFSVRFGSVIGLIFMSNLDARSSWNGHLCATLPILLGIRPTGAGIHQDRDANRPQLGCRQDGRDAPSPDTIGFYTKANGQKAFSGHWQAF
jgi:hypothetical protein